MRTQSKTRDARLAARGTRPRFGIEARGRKEQETKMVELHHQNEDRNGGEAEKSKIMNAMQPRRAAQYLGPQQKTQKSKDSRGRRRSQTNQERPQPQVTLPETPQGADHPSDAIRPPPLRHRSETGRSNATREQGAPSLRKHCRISPLLGGPITAHKRRRGALEGLIGRRRQERQH